MTIERLELAVRANREAPRSARVLVGRLLEDLPDEVLERARLLVSELVTNSIQHGGLRGEDEVVIEMRVADRRLRVEVRDPGRRWDPTLDERRLLERAGFGLGMLAQLADRWGLRRAGETVVWFEIVLKEPPKPTRP